MLVLKASQVEPAYVGRSGLAKHLGVSTRTIDRWTHDRVIPSFLIRGIIRFKLQEVEEALQTQFRLTKRPLNNSKIRRPRSQNRE